MNSQIAEDFLACFARLPDTVKKQARKAYRLWRENPSHPSSHFKRIHGHEGLHAVRVGLGWRALGLLEGDTITWLWIGSHADYDHLISSPAAEPSNPLHKPNHVEPALTVRRTNRIAPPPQLPREQASAG